MQGNVLGQSESSLSGLNVYAQLREPSKKDGVWIKTAETIVDENTTLPSVSKYKYDKVELVDEINFNGKYAQLANIPYNFYYGDTTSVGTYIYLFGGGNNSTDAYKYNTLTDTYTKIANIPFSFYGGKAIAIGTDIYLFNNTYAYRYNTLTDKYTKLANISYDFCYGSATVVEKNIFLFGSATDNRQKYAYKYNILTNTYTKLANIPFNFYYGSVVSIETNVYLFGGGSSQTISYKYDTLTDTYAQLEYLPNNFLQGLTIAIKNTIFLFGISDVKAQRYHVYKYDILKDKYTELTRLPNAHFYNGSIAKIDNNIYLFGGGDNNNNSNVRSAYRFEITSLNDKTIFIETKQLFKVLLTKQLEIHFSNAYISTDEELLEYTVYYGDGVRWRRVDGKDDLQNLITEDGNQIITEDGKIIKV